MWRRLSVVVGVVALGFAGLVGPASADFWVYEHDDQGGRSENFTGDDSNLFNNVWNDSGGNVNDNISSMRNNENRGVTMYEHANYAGDDYYARPNSEDDDLTNNGFDNIASSIDFS
ncbi:peptidase inhibitor family I36 protein [Allonocardiopsis opalescens]|uniref:Peptidase inhibitor family I36 n=1 Tax=Allonocardiopsis opalescens TaxID=1144618 RepID=A0A2T0Q0S7_9ACTN|nr:peptidase inhibitor family I36 protein [Allonocardiopsis opalescens]PRX97384.1 peptidase inhibitor family I36 [Allonocardiopsis opalescens]